jgi:ribosomal protein RSM22 (predicted rRNA methylase)
MPNLTDFLTQLESNLAEWLFEGNILANRKEICDRLSCLHTGYSQVRNNFYNLISDNTTASSYAIYYGLINAAKIYNLLELLSADFTPSSILDFGCGTGAATLASMYRFESINNVCLVEHNEFMTQTATRCINNFNNNVALDTFQIYEQITNQNVTYDIIVAANSINEIPFNERIDLILALIKKLSFNGYLIILEPGSLSITRELMHLRQSLLNTKNIKIVYPCTHNNECALLKLENQWCHSEITIDRPESIRVFDQFLNLNKHTISFSALILKNTDLNNFAQDEYRVITEPKDSKAGTTSYICGQNYQGLVMLQKRDRNDQNRYFRKLKMHSTCAWINEFKKI